MSFPPPPNENPPPGAGGGFGPPQGFGPPPPSGNGGYGPQPPGPGGFGYGPGAPGGPAGPGGYGPGGPGGPGAFPPYPPPPPPGPGKGPKVAGIVIGAVVVLAIVIGGIVWLGSSHSDNNSASADSSPSTSTTPTPSDSGPSDLPSQDPSDGTSLPGIPTPSASHRMMYVKLSPGDCFNSPGLDSHVQQITKVSCDSAHDGEVISNETLSGTINTEDDLKSKVLALCEPDAKKRLESIPRDGRTYYNYALYPELTTYQFEGEDTVSCSLTLSNSMDGKQLTGPLP